MVNQYAVSLAELQFATVICSECKTELTVDLEYDERRFEPNIPNPVIPPKCPTCHFAFDPQIIMGLNAVRDGYLRIKGQENVLVQFRVKESDAKSIPQPSSQSPKPRRP